MTILDLGQSMARLKRPRHWKERQNTATCRRRSCVKVGERAAGRASSVHPPLRQSERAGPQISASASRAQPAATSKAVPDRSLPPSTSSPLLFPHQTLADECVFRGSLLACSVQPPLSPLPVQQTFSSPLPPSVHGAAIRWALPFTPCKSTQRPARSLSQHALRSYYLLPPLCESCPLPSPHDPLTFVARPCWPLTHRLAGKASY